MALGIIEGIGIGAGGVLLLSAPKTPLHIKLAQPTDGAACTSGCGSKTQDAIPAPPCTVLGAGSVSLTTEQVFQMVLKETNSKQLQDPRSGKLLDRWREGLRNSIDDEQLYQGSKDAARWIQTPAGLHIIIDSGCSGQTQPPGAILHTVSSAAIEGLNTIQAVQLNQGDTGAAQVTGEIGQGVAAAAGVADIVLGFTQGVTAGLAATFTTVASFDPEPISRAILQVVGSIFGSIFKHHQQRVRIEHSVECAATPSVNESLQSIDAAVMGGNILPEHGTQLLDDLYNSYKAHLQSYGLVGRGSSGWGCNAGCELLWYLTGVITKKKDRFLRLTRVPCPPQPKKSLFAKPATYVLANDVAMRQQAVDAHYGQHV